MSRFPLLTLVLLALATASASGQESGRITGLVVDAATLQPVANAEVSLEGLTPEGGIAPGAEPEAPDEESNEVQELLSVDRLSLEIGIRLIPLVQDSSGTGILDHIAQLRRRIATRDGVARTRPLNRVQ